MSEEVMDGMAPAGSSRAPAPIKPEGAGKVIAGSSASGSARKFAALVAEGAAFAGYALFLPALWDVSLDASMLLTALGMGKALSGAAAEQATILLRLIAFAPLLAFLVIDLSGKIAAIPRSDARELGEVPHATLGAREALCGIAPALAVAGAAGPVGLAVSSTLVRQLKWGAGASVVVSALCLVLVLAAGAAAWCYCRGRAVVRTGSRPRRSPATCAIVSGCCALAAPMAAMGAAALFCIVGIIVAGTVTAALIMLVIEVFTALLMVLVGIILLPFIVLIAYWSLWR